MDYLKECDTKLLARMRENRELRISQLEHEIAKINADLEARRHEAEKGALKVSQPD